MLLIREKHPTIVETYFAIFARISVKVFIKIIKIDKSVAFQKNCTFIIYSIGTIVLLIIINKFRKKLKMLTYMENIIVDFKKHCVV